MASIETEVQLRGVNGGAEGLVAVEEGTWGGVFNPKRCYDWEVVREVDRENE